MREAQAQLEVRDDKLRELRTQLECARETEAKMTGMVQGLRNRLVEYEAHTAGLEARTSRSDLVIEALQQENRQANDRVIELETKLRYISYKLYYNRNMRRCITITTLFCVDC